jgi:hypothetical protein
MIGRPTTAAVLVTLAAATLGSFPAAAPAAAPAPSACPPPASTPVAASTVLLNGKPALPSPPPPAATQLIACVGKEAITGAVVAHWSQVAARDESRASGAVIASEVMGFLISAYWTLGEGEALGVRLSEAQVRHDFEHIRAQQFPKRREFERFLQRSGETVADLMFRVRINLTSMRIQAHLTPRHTSSKARLRALSRFVAAFKKRWTARTACATAYATSDCGSVF